MEKSLEEMLNSYGDEGESNVNTTDSEVVETKDEPTADNSTTETSVEDSHEGELNQTDGADNKGGVVADGDEGKETETEPDEPRTYNNNKRSRNFTQLEKAEYSAAKFKRRYKEMRAEKERLQAEFDKYKDLNPGAFENDEERQRFLAWKASRAQQLMDMDDDLEAMYFQHEREQFENKIEDCYNERGAMAFEKLHDHYGDAFIYKCQEVDPDNVIVDFLSGSRWEAPMREVIYKNGLLQEQLFRQFRNPTIAASERLKVLNSLEAQVEDFFKNKGRANASNRTGKASTGNVANVADNSKPTTTQPNNNGAQNQPRPRRFVLPPVSSTEQQQVTTQQPRPNVSRQVTGSLTRGSEPVGDFDTATAAAELMKEFMSR